MRLNRKDLAEMSKRTKQSKEDREAALNPPKIDDEVTAIPDTLLSGVLRISGASPIIWTGAGGDISIGSPPPPVAPTEAQKRKQLKALERLEKAQAKQEDEYWQKRDEQLANIKVDKSAPFLGLSEVMMMLKPRRG